MNASERLGPSLDRFKQLPVSQASLNAQRGYLDAYAREVSPLVSERDGCALKHEITARRMNALKTAQTKDARIAELRAQLAALDGKEAVLRFRPTPPVDAAELARAQIELDTLGAQLAEWDERIRAEDERLLREFGAT